MGIVIVLDTNVIQRDWLCRGFGFQLLRHLAWNSRLSVVTPAVVIEEVVANHIRERQSADAALKGLNRERARIGLPRLVPDESRNDYGAMGDHLQGTQPEGYRDVICDALAEQVGFSISGWPTVAHSSLVARATSRTPPFDTNGGGYRDALVWHTVLDTAASGDRVVLISADGAFRGKNGQLAPDLAEEATTLGLVVELSIDLSTWLQAEVPWAQGNLRSAVRASQDELLEEFLLQSDFVENLVPDAGTLGIGRWAEAVEISGVEWAGELVRLTTRGDIEGLSLVDHRLELAVEFRAIVRRSDLAALPSRSSSVSGWRFLKSATYEHELIEGLIDVNATLTTVFGNRDNSMWIDDVVYERADGLASDDMPSHNPALDPQLFEIAAEQGQDRFGR